MIHFFNPGHESAVLNGSKYYMAPTNVVMMQRDLAYLPAWYALPDDFVWINDSIDNSFIINIEEKFGKMPVILDKGNISNYNLSNESVDLWGISPQAIHQFEMLNNDLGLNLNLPVWNDNYKDLCSRKTSVKCLDFLINEVSEITEDILPCFCTSISEIENILKNNPNVSYLVKAPYSSSGRGLLWLPKGELSRAEIQILHGFFRKQGYVLLEKALDKVSDFAMEFSVKEKVLVYEGLSLFNTNDKGAYLSNFIGSQEIIKSKISAYIDLSLLENVRMVLSEFIKEHILPDYCGYLGVDMMIYQNEEKKILLHPCVEINLRSNMGRIALSISDKYISEYSTGSFHIEYSPQGTFDVDKNMRNEYPLICENNRVYSGYLSLCPVNQNSKYRAYLIVQDK
ncbi:MAG: hypothetical protein ACLVKO_12625 [Dysgonomonas sp.]